MNESFSIPHKRRIGTSARLHTTSRLYRRDDVGGYAVVGCTVNHFVAIRVPTGDVEQVNPCEDYEEAGEEGEGVDRIGGVEAAVEDEGGA